MGEEIAETKEVTHGGVQLIGSVQKRKNFGEFQLLGLRIGEDEDVRVLVRGGQGGVDTRVDQNGAVLKDVYRAHYYFENHGKPFYTWKKSALIITF